MKWMLALLLGAVATSAAAATIDVPAGGNLQAAINAAQPGDIIRLAPGATYVGNFVLPVHGGSSYVTIRTGGDQSLLPPAGTRITPAYSPYLARIKSPNVAPAMRLAPGAGYWRIELLEFLPTDRGMYDILSIGDGSSAQNSLALVPHHVVVDRVYIHGDAILGQKRGIALNGAHVTVVNSHISDIKAAGQDTQAIAGWNGPGPYHVENNHLEASGNVVLIGGDDPKIAGLVASDLVFRGNLLTRPLSWRDPIVPTPAGLRASTNAGSLPAGTYAYRVAARQTLGSGATGTSTPAAEVAVTVGNGAAVALSWSAVPNAKEYVVYGRSPGGQNVYWITTATSFTDDGGVVPQAGTPPTKGTVWTVKNLFELKNARHVQVDFNIMENNWAQAQSGVAVLFTPRNQYGAATWAVVEDVTFEYNIVRRVGGGVTITGWDDEHPSQQTNNIRIRHNEFSDYSRTWGGSGYFLLLDNQPRDVTVDHNTLISGSGLGMLVMSGPPMSGIVITNNVAKHDSYGIFGSGYGYGNAAIAYYMPTAVITHNVLAGGRATDYPAGNFFPTLTAFAGHFVNYAAGDYALVPGTDWERAGTDGLDLGAAMGALRAGWKTAAPDPPSIMTTTLPAGTEGVPYITTVEASGGNLPYLWRVYQGSLPAGLQLNPLNGQISGAPVAYGATSFTIEVSDANGLTGRQPLSIHIEQAIPPVGITTSALPDGTATLPYAFALDAEGGLGTYVWSLAGGTLPSGYVLSSTGVISGTTLTAGTFNVVITARDAADPGRSATRAYTLVVTPPPNVAPTISINPIGGPVAVGSPVTVTAQALDSDGVIVRVDFYLDGQFARSDSSAPFTYSWTATSGTHAFTAKATDDQGASTLSAEASVTTTAEIVMRARDAKIVGSRYRLTPDAMAADQMALWNPDLYDKKIFRAAAAPASYVEFQFYAEAGRPYHIWIRSRAQRNDYDNDSAYLQFSGVAGAKIGTTDAMVYQLEDGPTIGLSQWGWQDNGLGTTKHGTFGTHLVFERTGLQTLRIQQREDGLSIDQVVVSPDTYLLTSPGALKNDTTIVTR